MSDSKLSVPQASPEGASIPAAQSHWFVIFLHTFITSQRNPLCYQLLASRANILITSVLHGRIGLHGSASITDLFASYMPNFFAYLNCLYLTGLGSV